MTGDVTNPEDLNQIYLRDHEREIEIGAFTEERGVTQRVSFTIVVDVASGGSADDDVDSILSYDTLIDAIDHELAARRMDLLETLAEGIAARVLAHAAATSVTVEIEKLDRVSGALGVRISRSDAGEAQSTNAGGASVVCVGEGANLTDLGDGPNVIVVAGENITDQDNLRVRLLMSEASAWRLADAHPDLDVVASRTELDHAVRGGRSVLWAPSRMVFSAPEGAENLPKDLPGLADWLAVTINATSLIFVGCTPPPDARFENPIKG